MRLLRRILAATFAGLLALPAPVQAARVLLFSTGRDSVDEQAQSALEEAGHSITLGPNLYAFSGSVGPFPLDREFFDVAMLAPTYSGGQDMPGTGQAAIIGFVNSGGGLITAEHVVYRMAADELATLRAIIPALPSDLRREPRVVTYSRAAPDAVLDRELPPSFEFSFRSGIFRSGERFETALRRKDGATAFYQSDWVSAGVVGWDVPDGTGRVLTVSAPMGGPQINDPDFSRLVVNAVAWAANLDGDYLGNGRVAQADLDLVLLNWGAHAAPPPERWIHDLPSGRIDQDELDRVLLNWGGGGSGSPGAASVPEPSSCIILGLVLVTWMSLGPRLRKC